MVPPEIALAAVEVADRLVEACRELGRGGVEDQREGVGRERVARAVGGPLDDRLEQGERKVAAAGVVGVRGDGDGLALEVDPARSLERRQSTSG